MRATEEAAFARGISADALMEKAGEGIARAVTKFFPTAGRCIVFAGKGHNAGDAFVAARWLAQAGWEIETRLVFPEHELGNLTTEKLRALREEQQHPKWEGPSRPDPRRGNNRGAKAPPTFPDDHPRRAARAWIASAVARADPQRLSGNQFVRQKRRLCGRGRSAFGPRR